MKKRIIITIDLPDEIKRELLSYEKRWDNLNIKWINFYKMHLNLEFLGEVNRDGLEAIMTASQKTANNIKPFQIRLAKIELGLDTVQPKMILATIHIDANIMKLNNLIHQNLSEENFFFEESPFKPYIVMARARGNQLKGKKTSLVLKNLHFQARSMEIMESQLSLNLEKCKFLESFEFKK
ncbi:RNA 2',3'-cyclic phosphodiesterase [Patescibacteria group bacterium]|nr:RNA 2',3'-cyclic phosphodiesterase [Patescibacteria group bacterium]